MNTQPPKGLTIAVLGPDGSGKSTILNALVESLPPPFTAARILHFRPNLGRGTGDAVIVTNPHGKKPRGAIASSAKLVYYLADYLAGHLLVIRPAIRRGELVLFDRHYADLLVDPRRYRYGGPAWLAQLVGRLVPAPTVTVVLDAPTDVLQARKQEVPFEETARQRRDYRVVGDQMVNSCIVNVDRPVDEITSDILEVVSRSVRSSELQEQPGAAAT